MNEDTSDVRLLVSVVEEHGYLMLRGDIVCKNTDGQIRNFVDSTDLSRFGIAGQLDTYHAKTYGYACDFYGTDLCFRDVSRMRLHEAEAAVKELRRITRRLERHAERFGAPVDSADLLARIAAAVNTTATRPFLRRAGEPLAPARYSYDSESYPEMDADSMRYYLRECIRTWMDKRGLVPTAVAS